MKTHWIVMNEDGDLTLDEDGKIREFSGAKEAVKFIENKLADEECGEAWIYKLTHHGTVEQFEPEITVEPVKS